MRILVLSDSHGDRKLLRQVILEQTAAEVVIHLGDSEIDMGEIGLEFPEKMFLSVRGNCDYASDLPLTGQREFEGVKVFFAHGHTLNVKSGLETAKEAARACGTQVLLYGHTHQALTDYEDGLYIMNPGALKGWNPRYGTLDITPQGIVTNVIQLGSPFSRMRGDA